MKFLTKIFSFFLLIPTFVFAGTPFLTHVPIDNIYSPKGFDTNDNTEIIISGFLPNLCHKAPTTSYELISNTIHVSVQALKYDPSNPFCAEMIVPFVESVNIGILDKGNYDIVVNGQTVFEKSSNIYIEEAGDSAIDDFTYANVEYVEKSMNGRKISLIGHNPSDCFVLDEVKVVDNNKDTFSILPIMKQVSEFCPQKMIPFTYDVEIPQNLKTSKVLLHVRVMDGKSVNTLFPNLVK